MIHIENKEQFNEAIKNGNVIVDFFATWCGPCRMLSPILEEIDNERDDITVIKVNVDEQDALAVLFNVSSIPLLIFFKDGVNKGNHLGYTSKANLLDMLDRYF